MRASFSARRRPQHLAKHRSAAFLTAAALLVPVVAVNLPVSPAQAVSGSSFDAVNGRLDPTAPRTKDWNNAATTVPSGLKYGIDTPTGKNDTSFAGGVDENTVNPGVRTGAIPNSKDDLARFYTAYEQLGTGSSAQQMLYLAWVRNKTSGSADMDFELNQSQQVASNGLPVRTPGDILITYEFISSKSPAMSLLRWRASSNRCWSGTSDVAGTSCWAERAVLNSTNSEGAVNDGFSVIDKTRVGGITRDLTLASQTFGEAAINLTALGVFTPSTCMKFARAFAKTRSSHSFSSSLQDYIAPIEIDLSNCLTKSFAITAPHSTPAGTTLNAVFSVGSAPHVVPLTYASGQLTGSDSTIPPGSTLSGLHLELRNAAGAVLWRTPDQTEVMGTSSKLNTGSFDYAVTLTPASAENFAGRPHELTSVLTGTGALNSAAATTAPIPGVSVGWRLENGTPAGCGSLSPSSALTSNPAGIATTTLTSSTACSTTIRAFVDRAGSAAGYDSSDVSRTATKTFVAYALSVSPASATNVMGTNHTFTVSLTRNTGSGAVGYAGQTVAFSLTNAAATGARLVSVNGAGASGTSGSCTTTSAGVCQVVATATKTGTFTLAAVYQTTNDSGLGTFNASGAKTYTDYRVSVTPASATNEVGDAHTFVAKLEQSTNDAWVPVSGATLALSLSKGTTDATVTSISPAGPDASSCTTGTAGTCSVTINASTPGLVTLTATYNRMLDSGALTRSASGTKQYNAYTLTVTHVGSSLNSIGDPHTFLVSLRRFDGSSAGGTPYAGRTVGLSLTNAGGATGSFTSINDAPAGGTGPATCTTRADGTCSVVITSPTAGTVTLNASYTETLAPTSTVSLNASAVKRYVGITVSKAACALSVPIGGTTTFSIPWTVVGSPLANARIIDNLPAGLTYVSSSPEATTHPATGQSGQVVWNLGTITPPASGEVKLTVAVAQAGSHVNTGVFVADEGISKPFTAGAVTTSTTGAAASGRAYGIRASLAGTDVVPPTPDVAGGAAELASLALPLELAPVASGRVGLLEVSNDPSLTDTGASDEAQATTANVDLTVAGIRIQAAAVAARSTSVANGATAATSTAGSQISGLTISGGLPVPGAPALPRSAVVDEPGVITVANLLGQEVLRVYLLEKVAPSGAAAGVPQPESTADGRLLRSGQGVNGIRVDVLASTLDVVVSHAASRAAFPSLDQCGLGSPYVIGSAAVLDKDTTVADDVTTVTLGEVVLGSTGGDQVRQYNRTELGLIGLDARTAYSETHGRLAPLQASSAAGIEALSLQGITADAVQVTAASSGGATSGSTRLVRVVVAGTNVCTALGLTATCDPPKNSEVLNIPGLRIVLNEHVVSGKTITVNAIHIWALGANGLALPVGSDLVISTATAGTS